MVPNLRLDNRWLSIVPDMERIGISPKSFGVSCVCRNATCFAALLWRKDKSAIHFNRDLCEDELNRFWLVYRSSLYSRYPNWKWHCNRYGIKCDKSDLQLFPPFPLTIRSLFFHSIKLVYWSMQFWNESHGMETPKPILTMRKTENQKSSRKTMKRQPFERLLQTCHTLSIRLHVNT